VLYFCGVLNYRTDFSFCDIPQHNPRSPTQLADVIVERVLQHLKDLGRVPRDFTRRPGRHPAAWTISRTTQTVIGRERDVEVVLKSLRRHGAAAIWGGPGEGKTTIAMEAAAQLRIDEPNLDAFTLDMRGKRAALVSGCPPLAILEPRLCPSLQVGSLLLPYRD
jgi:hypothetical protein